ncbi:lysophospholipid acyltransferase family protein [Hymenobacter fodinae]|uniref:Lauroyl acyltransferase n=1 Tax=Hymenobacter fodinae TaxID=2510796 RepID=A0A4Z0P7X3_9BACT|nr:lysophospholipid acyltransferase family protein [Hymenobacter fodinae]TGE08045.1 lauroyl acyltransferase [Hymenobacter fodinae]
MNPPARPFLVAYPWYYRPLEWLLLAIASLPLSVLYGVAYGLYLLLAYVVRYRYKVVVQNLRNSFPEKTEAEVRQLAKDFYRHFADLIVEILKLTTISRAELTRRVRLTHADVADRFFAQGRPVIALASHAGNWDWVLSAGTLLMGAPATGVYKPMSNPFFEHFMYRLRSRTGAGLVPMRDTLRNMVQYRDDVRSISLLSDQAAGPEDRPYWTTFMHQDAGFYTSAERLASKFKFPVIYVGIRRLRRGYYEIDLAELHDGDSPIPTDSYPITEAFVRHLEQTIRENPAAYLWSHRRWKHKRPVPAT